MKSVTNLVAGEIYIHFETGNAGSFWSHNRQKRNKDVGRDKFNKRIRYGSWSEQTHIKLKMPHIYVINSIYLRCGNTK